MTQFIEVPLSCKEETHNAYQNELMNLLDFLRKVHPAFLEDKSLYARMDALAKQLCGELADEKMALEKFQILLNRFVAMLSDAHTSVAVASQTLFPYTIRYWEGEFYVYSTSHRYKAVLGKCIDSIGNRPMAAVKEELKQWIPSENEIKAGITGSFYLNNRYFLEAIRVYDGVGSLTMTFTDGQSVQFALSDEKADCVCGGIHTNTLTKPKDVPFCYQIVDGICYFQFNAMMDRATYLLNCKLFGIDADKELADSLPDFAEFLDAMYAEMEQASTELLVVDIRYNGGGNSLLGDMLLETLLPEEQSFARYETYLRMSDFLQKHTMFPVAAEAVKDGLVNQKAIKWMDEFANRKRLPRRYTGRVLFIQGQNTFSSANYLATTIKDNRLFTLIGSDTSQKPTCYGDILPVVLPYTQTKAFVSHSYFCRPCSALDADDRLSPDVTIKNPIADLQSGKDNCWEWICQNKHLITS